MNNISSLADKDIAADILSDIKELSSGYHLATVEAANENLRSTFFDSHNDTLNDQKQLFDCMHSKGWYKIPQA